MARTKHGCVAVPIDLACRCSTLGLGFRSLEFGVKGVESLGLRVQGLGFRGLRA